MTPPTALQTDYVRGLQRRLKLSNALLDAHCIATFGAPFREIDKRQCSDLLDEMKDWNRIPAQLLREAGQTDVFEAGS